MRTWTRSWPVLVAGVFSLPAIAGPPYLTDDPQPTDAGHYETYFFVAGASARDGDAGSGGVDFNFGAADDLQLTAVLPIAWNAPAGGKAANGLGNVELAAKYQFLHQRDHGFDVAFFPRVFLPAGNASVGERNASLLLPLWVQHSWDTWSVFGGGGCEIHRGGGARDFCQFGLATTKQAMGNLQIGMELYHHTPDAADSRSGTDANFGMVYDIDPRLHLMASFGKGLQNRADTDRTIWYAALLWTL
ncbi:MAG: transporter [Proteobacteria bacterium]|nr:transporter [Pseudomonadota bacterium]